MAILLVLMMDVKKNTATYIHLPTLSTYIHRKAMSKELKKITGSELLMDEKVKLRPRCTAFFGPEDFS